MNWAPWLPYLPVLQGLALVGATSGALGCYAVLRRQSLLSDTLAHAALPGICIAFWITGDKLPLPLLIGASVAGVIGTLLVLGILHGSRLKQDAALGIVLSMFFGLGIVLMSMLQGRAEGRLTGIEHFIFGQAALLTAEHVNLMAWTAVVVFLVVLLFYKEFKLLSFDPEYAATLGFSRRFLDLLQAVLIVLAVMISLRAVGVVLTVALLIAPAAAARQWTQRLSVMMLLGMVFGVLSGLLGAIWSQNISSSPLGPVIVVAASIILAFSLLVAPQRGLLWAWLRLRKHRQTVRRENLLTDFYRLSERRPEHSTSFAPTELAAVRGQPAGYILRPLRQLQRDGLAESAGDTWRLTTAGRAEASRVVRNHRLWELYLARRLDLAPDHVHRDAEEMEHALPPEIVAELEAALDNPEVDPHGHRIPRSE